MRLGGGRAPTEINVLEFSLLVAGTSLPVGFLGSLTGLGVGVVLILVYDLVTGEPWPR